MFIDQHANGTASPLLQWTFLLLQAMQYMAVHADRIKKSQVSHRPKLAAAGEAAAAQGYRDSGLNSTFERSQREADIIQANADKVQKASIAMRDQLREFLHVLVYCHPDCCRQHCCMTLLEGVQLSGFWLLSCYLLCAACGFQSTLTHLTSAHCHTCSV